MTITIAEPPHPAAPPPAFAWPVPSRRTVQIGGGTVLAAALAVAALMLARRRRGPGRAPDEGIALVAR